MISLMNCTKHLRIKYSPRTIHKNKLQLPSNERSNIDVVQRRAICTPKFIAAMATVAKLWKQLRCPSMDEWIRKMWSIYTMEYYASIRKDEYPTFVATWTGLKEIMLSEISQAERVNYHMVSLICGA